MVSIVVVLGYRTESYLIHTWLSRKKQLQIGDYRWTHQIQSRGIVCETAIGSPGIPAEGFRV